MYRSDPTIENLEFWLKVIHERTKLPVGFKRNEDKDRDCDALTISWSGNDYLEACVGETDVTFPTIAGKKKKKCPALFLYGYRYIPGTWDGLKGVGSPPDVDEIELGTFTSPSHCARKIIEVIIWDMVNNVLEDEGMYQDWLEDRDRQRGDA